MATATRYFAGCIITFATVSQLPVADPRVHPGIIRSPGTVGVSPGGVYFLKTGTADTDWLIADSQVDAVTGDPYRTPGKPAPVGDLDPHRRWLLANIEWHYEELDWSDEGGIPARIVWRMDTPDVRIEVMSGARSKSGDSTINPWIFVHVAPIVGVRELRVNDRGDNSKWVLDAKNVWFSNLGEPASMWHQKGTALREHIETRVRNFLAFHTRMLAKQSASADQIPAEPIC